MHTDCVEGVCFRRGEAEHAAAAAGAFSEFVMNEQDSYNGRTKCSQARKTRFARICLRYLLASCGKIPAAHTGSQGCNQLIFPVTWIYLIRHPSGSRVPMRRDP